MKLIKKLGTRISKSNRLVSWGEFLCSECNKLAEMHNVSHSTISYILNNKNWKK